MSGRRPIGTPPRFSGFADSFTPGDYEDTAQGYGGPVKVKLSFDNEKVVAALVEGPEETEGIGGAAIESYNTRLVGIRSVDEVDAVSGATRTSNAVIKAVESCFAQARNAVAGNAPVFTFPSRIIAPPTISDINDSQMLVPYYLQVFGNGDSYCLNIMQEKYLLFLFYDENGNYSHTQIMTRGLSLENGKTLEYDIYSANLDDLAIDKYGELHGIRWDKDYKERLGYTFKYPHGLASVAQLGLIYYSDDGAYTNYYWNPGTNDGWYCYTSSGKTYTKLNVEKRTDLIPIPTLVFTGDTLALWDKNAVPPLTTLELPRNLTRIDSEAFMGVSAQKIVIPDRCTYIGSRAFANCPNLVEISVPHGISIPSDACSGCGNVTVTERPAK